MPDYDAATYGDRIAEIYDDLYLASFDTEGAVSFLAEKAGDGPALELGIGTGRIALPLAERGIEVHGIDTSEAMVAKMRAKAGGDVIRVEFGDFVDVPIEGEYPLVFVVFNTLFALGSQDDQVRCFERVAEHLVPGGVFVLEAFVPDLGRFDRDQRVSVEAIQPDRVMLDVARHDAASQRVFSRHLFLGEQGIQAYPVQIRYAWPSELDLMARIAGLSLRERWGGWRREPFGSGSPKHVSVYGKR